MKIGKQRWDEMQEKYMADVNLSLSDIAAELGLSKQAVSAYANAHNWVIRNARPKSAAGNTYPIPEQKRGMNLSPEAAAKQALADELLYVLAKKGVVRNTGAFLFRLMEGIYSPKTVKGAFGGNTGMTATFYKTVMHKLKQLPDYDWNV